MRASQVGFTNVVGFEVSAERVKALQPAQLTSAT
jgi:hypothetical protein